MKHGREEEDRGSESSKSSLSASSDTSASSTASKQQALRFAEDLCLPSVCALSLSLCLEISSRLVVGTPITISIMSKSSSSFRLFLHQQGRGC
jgi:hypothetical protein